MKISMMLATPDKTELAILLLHAKACGVFIAHGVQKLLGWSGSSGLKTTRQWTYSIGPPGYWMLLTGRYSPDHALQKKLSNHPEG